MRRKGTRRTGMKPKGTRRTGIIVLLWGIVLAVCWFVPGYRWPKFGVVLVGTLGVLYVMYRLVDWDAQ